MADFILRPWRMRDASSIYKYAHNRKIADMLKDAFPYPYTYEDAKAYISSCMQAQGKDRLALAIEVEGLSLIHISDQPLEPLMIALALLPAGVDVGSRLLWENLQYTLL